MMRILDRAAGVLLLLGAAGHTVGTLLTLPPSHEAFIWSLGSSLAAALVGTLNLIRVGRPSDRTLAWICLGGSLGWAAVVVGFGLIIGQLLDPRVDMHLVASLALVGFSARTLLGRGAEPASAPAAAPARS
jgi:hypothetical protein